MLNLALLGALLAVALARYPGTPGWGGPAAWAYVLAVATLLAAGLGGLLAGRADAARRPQPGQPVSRSTR